MVIDEEGEEYKEFLDGASEVKEGFFRKLNMECKEKHKSKKKKIEA